MAPGHSSPLKVISEHEVWGNVNPCYFGSDSNVFVLFFAHGNFKLFRKVLAFWEI